MVMGEQKSSVRLSTHLEEVSARRSASALYLCLEKAPSCRHYRGDRASCDAGWLDLPWLVSPNRMWRGIRSKHETSVELEDDSIAPKRQSAATNLPNDMATVNAATTRRKLSAYSLSYPSHSFRLFLFPSSQEISYIIHGTFASPRTRD
jgi:hypothetical protein